MAVSIYLMQGEGKENMTLRAKDPGFECQLSVCLFLGSLPKLGRTFPVPHGTRLPWAVTLAAFSPGLRALQGQDLSESLAHSVLCK